MIKEFDELEDETNHLFLNFLAVKMKYKTNTNTETDPVTVSVIVNELHNLNVPYRLGC